MKNIFVLFSARLLPSFLTNFLRTAFLALRQNEIVVIAFDGRDGGKWESVDFFSKKALFSTGPFEIARKTGATIIPAFIIRNKNDIHRMILKPPFALSKDMNKEKAVRKDTMRFAKLFGRYVADYPCHFGKILYNYRIQKITGTANPFLF